MKKTIALISFLVIIFFYGLYMIYSKNNSPEEPIHEGNLSYESIKNNYTQLYKVDSLPTRLDSISFSIVFKLNSNKKKHVLVLPNAGTETGITITDTKFESYGVGKHKTLAEGSFYANEPILIDITNFKTGHYIIGVYGCDIAGTLSMTLE